MAVLEIIEIGHPTLREIAEPVPVDEIRSPAVQEFICLLYTSPSPRDATLSRMPSSA